MPERRADSGRREPVERRPGLNVVRVPRDGLTEVFVTVSPVEGEGPSGMSRRLDDFLQRQSGARILREDIFGGEPPEHARGSSWPVTRVLEKGAGPTAAIQLHALVPDRDGGASVRPIRTGLRGSTGLLRRSSIGCEGRKLAEVRDGALPRPRRGLLTTGGVAAGGTTQAGGRVVGTVVEDASARYCILGDIRPEDASLPRGEQARRTFEMMEAALGLAGMDFSNVVRTWLYLDGILSWYDDFNEARTSFFTERGVFDGLVPASTGIGGSNPAGTAVTAEAFAVACADDRVRAREVPSPLQCPAVEYGSSFSRAVELRAPDHRRLFVSGTASIGPDARTRHVGDVDSQIGLTMEVVHAILESRGMDWSDVARAVAYVKRTADRPAFAAYCADRGLAALPVAIVPGAVCRDELLFEIEVDAVVPGGSARRGTG